ncbi:hypothetical protein B6U79_01820 [Candidatus Bathyarchaeota archaeon ex4484_231]|nr:MAG: hypothetical protein B6U79_01820 [Candidatus Bathyarchaeota archaeon ex4484_231]
MALNIGDTYECPEGHKAKIVWISEDKKVIAVKCPQRHFSKVVKVADHERPALSSRRYYTKKKRIYVRNLVFLIRL